METLNKRLQVGFNQNTKTELPGWDSHGACITPSVRTKSSSHFRKISHLSKSRRTIFDSTHQFLLDPPFGFDHTSDHNTSPLQS
jgi:hypothetical protein